MTKPCGKSSCRGKNQSAGEDSAREGRQGGADRGVEKQTEALVGKEGAPGAVRMQERDISVRQGHLSPLQSPPFHTGPGPMLPSGLQTRPSASVSVSPALTTVSSMWLLPCSLVFPRILKKIVSGNLWRCLTEPQTQLSTGLGQT